ncbi:ABC transporter ATP-binding protein [Candidatus Neomarinimicrobiota bacterium]
MRIEALVKTFGPQEVLGGIDINIAEGSIFCLLGPNGAGKTTLIRILMSLISSDSGRLIYRGGPLLASDSRQFGYLPEERGLYQSTNLLETLVYFAQLHQLDKAVANSRVQAWLERFGLLAQRNALIRSLSRGNQQKAQLICALVHEPQLLILDEPFLGLDLQSQSLVRDLIREQSAAGTTIIFATHQLAQAERLCDEVCLLNRGKIILDGSLEELKAKGKQLVEVEFKAEIPLDVERYLQIENRAGTKLTGSLKLPHDDTLKALANLGSLVGFRAIIPSLEEIILGAVEAVD